jgi:hypothetical protein
MGERLVVTHALVLVQEAEALALDHALVNKNVRLRLVVGLDKTCAVGGAKRSDCAW